MRTIALCIALASVTAFAAGGDPVPAPAAPTATAASRYNDGLAS